MEDYGFGFLVDLYVPGACAHVSGGLGRLGRDCSVRFWICVFVCISHSHEE